MTMNFRVSELTEIALQILGYKMFDRHGAPTDSLQKVIEKQQFSTGKDGSATVPVLAPKEKAIKRKHTDAAENLRLFRAQFSLPDFDTILASPNQYVGMQMQSFLEQVQARYAAMRIEMEDKAKVRGTRTQNSRKIVSELDHLNKEIKRASTAMSLADDDELIARIEAENINVQEYLSEKQDSLLCEFNNLLQLLKHIIEDLSRNFSDYDAAYLLVQKTYDMVHRQIQAEDSRNVPGVKHVPAAKSSSTKTSNF